MDARDTISTQTKRAACDCTHLSQTVSWLSAGKPVHPTLRSGNCARRVGSARVLTTVRRRSARARAGRAGRRGGPQGVDVALWSSSASRPRPGTPYRAFSPPAPPRPPGGTHQTVHLDRRLDRAEPVDLERLHVEHVDALQLAEQLEALETGRLVLAEEWGRGGGWVEGKERKGGKERDGRQVDLPGSARRGGYLLGWDLAGLGAL